MKFLSRSTRGFWMNRPAQLLKEIQILQKSGRDMFQQEFPTRVYRRPRTLEDLLIALKSNATFKALESGLIFMREGKDPWDRDLRFESNSDGFNWTCVIRSAGADGQFNESAVDKSDDLSVVIHGNLWAPVTPATIQFLENDELATSVAGKMTTPDFLVIPISDRKKPYYEE